MAFILHIETSGPICSIALSENEKLLGYKETTEPQEHAGKVTLLIASALSEAGLKVEELDAIAVSKGPGSYTGLRIGVSAAKGLCYALDKPLIGVNSLQSLTKGIFESPLAANISLFCPMIDARRMEVYSCLLDTSMNERSPVKAEIIDEHSYAEELKHEAILFFGTGALKCSNIITHPNALFDLSTSLSAKYMIQLAYDRFNKAQFENTAYFEPFYLKEFFFKK